MLRCFLPRAVGAFYWSLLSVVPLHAQFPRVTYEVQAGSVLEDTCIKCERRDIEYHLRGTFVLERLAVKIKGFAYSISDVKLTCVGLSGECQLEVTGEGSHYRPDLENQSTELTLNINGRDGIVLKSEAVRAEAAWPAFDTSLGEDRSQDPISVFTLRLVAAPRVEQTDYELVPGDPTDESGSFLEVVCPVCRPADPRVPLGGSFKVGLIESVENGFSVYSLSAIEWRGLLVPPRTQYSMVGSGTYEEGGGSAPMKQMRLTLEVNSSPWSIFRGGPVSVLPGEAFPLIVMDVEEELRETRWYRLHLVARPSTPRKFRRADSNTDAKVDLADAVFTLNSLFVGGAGPACLDAADADASGKLDLTDVVVTLGFLFLGGPAPGPATCGIALEARLGCANYGVCGPG